MPIYEYRCEKCGKVFEYQQKITDDALTHCPVEICEQEVKGQGKVHRIISSNVGLLFKGSGFYLTDYAKKNGSAAKVKNGNSKSKESSEPKTATTKETKSGD